MALELSEASEYRQHQPPMWGSCIAPRITERLERCATLRDLSRGSPHLGCGAGHDRHFDPMLREGNRECAPKPAPIAKVPVWLSGTPGSIRRRPPMLGEHTDQILAKLGYDKKAIAGLRKKGVV